MISPVSSVNFGNVAVSGQNALNRPGRYTMPENVLPEVKPKKKGKFLKGLAKTVVAAAVIAGGLALGAKKNWFKLAPDLAKAKLMEKASHYLRVGGDFVVEKAGKIWQSVTKLVSKKP